MMADCLAIKLPKKHSAPGQRDAIIARPPNSASVPALIGFGQNECSSADLQFSSSVKVRRDIGHELKLKIGAGLGSPMKPKLAFIDLRILDCRRTTRVVKAAALKGATDELVIVEGDSLVLENLVFVAHISIPIASGKRTLVQTRNGATIVVGPPV
ncbi:MULTISPECIES: hypothetical protein [unclassified Erythrobacter]|uniref:hypothetical protein n=1 Tax=unclassified Erythrobacter TaxID=2633097 RepID=UPI0012E88BA8|nr:MULTISPECIES: hypothetical protein [unclassified Erythrobacter]